MPPIPSSHFHKFVGYDEIANTRHNHGGRQHLPWANLDIRDMFSQTQKEVLETTAFHSHPVVLMVVNFMQKAHEWSWRDKEVYRTIFPGLQKTGSPNQFDIERMSDSIFRGDGTHGLLAKCFYNALSDYAGQLNDGKFNTAIASLNASFNEDAAHLYAEYFRHAYNIMPSAENVIQYQDLLLSKAYRMLKRAQLASSSWPNPNMEIFIHFVKLLACGASTAEVKTIYDSLTSGDYAINPGAFPAMAGDWKSYRGWLSADYLDWGDLNARNLGDEYLSPPSYVSMVRLVAVFANWFDYWKPSGGSCFSADTSVVLADGSTREISKIQKGNQVLSHVFWGGKKHTSAAKVAFVSKPKRSQRMLYSYRDAPRIKFTDTHPLVVECKDDWQHRSPLLKFIIPDLASTLNQSWQSIPALQIPLDAVDHHNGKHSDPDEILYDLVFEPQTPSRGNADLGPTTYIVSDLNGQRFEVASEAPIFHWFPYLMKFFETVLRALLRGSHDFSSIASSLIYRRIAIGSIAREAWTKFQRIPSEQVIPQQGFFTSLESVLGKAEGLPDQMIADVYENLHAQYGRNINHEIITGWAHMPPVGSNTDRPSKATILFLDSVHFLGMTVPPTQLSETHHHIQVHLLQNGNRFLTTDVSASRRGWQTFEMYRAVDLSAYTPDLNDEGCEVWHVGFELYDPLAKVTYRGQGPLCEDVLTIVGLGSTTENQHAVMDVKVMKVNQRALNEQESWTEEKRMVFAEALGECFAGELAHQST